MILAIDTSTQQMGVALSLPHTCLGEMTWQTRSHHSVELAPAVQFLMEKCQVQASQLKGLAVAIGPGSFTSLRIGLAFMKGMALSLRIPLLGIPTLDIAAAGIQPRRTAGLVCVLQAGRSRLAVGRYKYDHSQKQWNSIAPFEVMNFDELKSQFQTPTLVSGELDADQRAALARKKRNVILASPADAMRRPAHLAHLAWKRLQLGEADEPESLAPLYVHVNDPLLTP